MIYRLPASLFDQDRQIPGYILSFLVHSIDKPYHMMYNDPRTISMDVLYAQCRKLISGSQRQYVLDN